MVTSFCYAHEKEVARRRIEGGGACTVPSQNHKNDRRRIRLREGYKVNASVVVLLNCSKVGLSFGRDGSRDGMGMRSA